jgi:hypothetical protein
VNGMSSKRCCGEGGAFSFANFSWLNGNARTKDLALDTKFFTPEIRADVDYVYDFHHPKDNTIGGSSAVFRSNEVQVTQLGGYLVLLPPINGATAASATPYFSENPGDPFKTWNASGTFDYMPSQYSAFRWEFDHRAADAARPEHSCRDSRQI